MQAGDHIRSLELLGLEVTVDDALGKLCVHHHGLLSWDNLQDIKNAVWGPDARAIEVYPRAADAVNNGLYRHLWRLGEHDFCPDLLGFTAPPVAQSRTLENRCYKAWSEAARAFG